MNKLHKSSYDKKIFGVCGGIAEYFNIDSTIVRLIAAILILSLGSGLMVYLVAALILPSEEDLKRRQSEENIFDNE